MTKHNENTKKEFVTINKTYMFFETDIKELNRNGWTAKEIFRLGIMAKKDNPQLINRINALEAQNNYVNNRITNLSKLMAKKLKSF